MMFKDERLQEGIGEILNINMNKQDVTKKKLTSFTYLNVSHRDIQWIDGLEHCTELKSLFLIGNRVVDLEPLSDMRSLTLLDLSMNEDLNFHTLRHPVKSVEKLFLRSCKLDDLSFVEYFPNLRQLSLFHNNINDIKNLTLLKELRAVNLDANLVSQEEVEAYMGIYAVDKFQKGSEG